MKNSNILHLLSLTFSNIRRASSLFIQGFVFGSKFGRFEFRRSFLRPWLNSLGGVGAWLLSLLCASSLFFALYVLLWFGYLSGMIM